MIDPLRIAYAADTLRAALLISAAAGVASSACSTAAVAVIAHRFGRILAARDSEIRDYERTVLRLRTK